jgi:trk system potassium uptake protein TrkH
MWVWLQRLPLFLVFLLGIGLAMLLPTIHAAAMQDFAIMRSFLYAGLLLIFLTLAIGVVVVRPDSRDISQRDQLLMLVGVFVVLPAIMAVPFQHASAQHGFFDAWFEMVSSLTTTGATLVVTPESFPMTLHLWRAQVGWMGGFAILVAAIALLAPMHLGGFEIIGSTRNASRGRSLAQSAVREGAAWRIGHWARKLFPIYAGLTLLLWLALAIGGQDAATALIHAMAVMSTSGISPVDGLQAAQTGFWIEVVVFAFLLIGLSRLTLMPDDPISHGQGILADREFRLGLLIIAGVSAALFLHHWFGAVDQAGVLQNGQGWRVLWGEVFTVLSYLTTTGFKSAYWEGAVAWSGLQTPGIVLAGLAVIGGGVATTAGGVKLLRVYALFGQGRQEMEHLVYPSAVGQSGHRGRRISLEGAQIAWVFFMLYALSVAVVMGLLAFAGVDFEQAAILTVSALSTTGPVGPEASGIPTIYADLGTMAKAVLMATMVIGRLETLALIALLNPNFWRN